MVNPYVWLIRPYSCWMFVWVGFVTGCFFTALLASSRISLRELCLTRFRFLLFPVRVADSLAFLGLLCLILLLILLFLFPKLLPDSTVFLCGVYLNRIVYLMLSVFLADSPIFVWYVCLISFPFFCGSAAWAARIFFRMCVWADVFFNCCLWYVWPVRKYMCVVILFDYI